jgi:hypothetical protein
MPPLITIDNLDKGLESWFSHKDWEGDLHSEFYRNLYKKRETLSIEKYWLSLVENLAGWRAMRPVPKNTIIERGKLLLSNLERNIRYIKRRYSDVNSILDANWPDLELLFDFSKKIKGVESPVFASKMCHFIFPNLYPVIDNEYVGIGSGYYAYWKECKAGWLSCPNPQEIINHFITMGKLQLFDKYPYHTKIAEICSAGKRK